MKEHVEERVEKPKAKKPRIQRNRGGCFCCRKRKIKCDGRKPTCANCEKGSYLCQWPENGDASLSHNTEFKLTKINTPIKFINLTPPSGTTTPPISTPRTPPIDLSKTKPVSFESDNKSSSEYSENDVMPVADQKKEKKEDEEEEDIEEINDDALIRNYIRESVKSVIPSNLRGLIGLNMTTEELRLYDAFVNGFIVSISNQLAHHKLLPGTIYIPSGIFDPFVRKLCMTCGASFLYRCKNDNELMLQVQRENDAVVKELINKLDVMPIMESREWILIYFTLRNARQHFIYEGRYSQTINLISGIQAIKLWLETKKREEAQVEMLDEDLGSNHISTSVDLNQNTDGDIAIYDEQSSEADSYILLDKLVDRTNQLKSINEEYGFEGKESSDATKDIPTHLIDMLGSEVLGATIGDQNKRNTTTSNVNHVSAFERTLLENFIFNYSGTLLIIDKSLINCVPSPFEVFDMIAPLLFVPIYNCAVPWMNNPTAGAALPMIELQAKIIWLSFKKIYDESDIKMIKTIQSVAQFYTRPIIPDEIWNTYPKKITKKLLESCYVSELVAKGVYLFSMKILDRNLSIYDDRVQELVNSFLKILDSISLHSQSSVVAKWSFIVIGSAIIDVDKRLQFKKRLLGFIEALKTGSLITAIQFLEHVWRDGVGLDALFIEKYLDLLAI